MSDVNETLQELVERRLREMGQRRGRGESFSLREAWMRLPEHPNGNRAVSYETVRRIRENGHTNIGDATADALATMFDVSVDDVLTAAGQRPRLGEFQLPSRAQQLTPAERQVVLGVVDAILDAAGTREVDTDLPPRRRTEPRLVEVKAAQERAGLRAVASGGDADDAEQVDELARKARKRLEDDQRE